MLTIPGIDRSHVEQYGDRYLALVSKAKDHLSTVRGDEFHPHDPNHQVIHVLSSDDDNAIGSDLDLDNEYSEGSQGPAEETSAYFQQTQKVKDFNAQSKQ